MRWQDVYVVMTCSKAKKQFPVQKLLHSNKHCNKLKNPSIPRSDRHIVYKRGLFKDQKMTAIEKLWRPIGLEHMIHNHHHLLNLFFQFDFVVCSMAVILWIHRTNVISMDLFGSPSSHTTLIVLCFFASTAHNLLLVVVVLHRFFFLCRSSFGHPVFGRKLSLWFDFLTQGASPVSITLIILHRHWLLD